MLLRSSEDGRVSTGLMFHKTTRVKIWAQVILSSCTYVRIAAVAARHGRYCRIRCCRKREISIWVMWLYKECDTAVLPPTMMFASNSPYSPFFTSGLLCHSIFDGIRRGSLPTDKPKDQSIFSNQPEYRSFLSLDLAESQSMRSANLKRKHSAPPLVFCLSISFLGSSLI